MGIAVYANGMSIACKAADGKTIAAMPDTCLSPPSPPAGPVPLPYPNTAYASDTTKGSKTVMIGGEEIMLKDQSTFKTSTGDEAATKSLGMGVVTHEIQGEVSFVSWSMDVKFEGQNIPRHLDMTLHNEMCSPANTPPWLYLDGMTIPATDPRCKKLARELQKTVQKLPKSKQGTTKKPATIAVGQTPLGVLPGASSVSGGEVMRAYKRVLKGGRYRGNDPYTHFAEGLGDKPKSDIKTCDGKQFEYKESGRPYSGHAEAKIIEDFFALGGEGTLLLKISRPPCPECTRLIFEVNKGTDGKGNCQKIFVCE